MYFGSLARSEMKEKNLMLTRLHSAKCSVTRLARPALDYHYPGTGTTIHQLKGRATKGGGEWGEHS